jgi:hypothetical protein
MLGTMRRGKAMLQRRARRLALILMVLSGIIVAGVIGALWFLLGG